LGGIDVADLIEDALRIAKEIARIPDAPNDALKVGLEGCQRA